MDAFENYLKNNYFDFSRTLLPLSPPEASTLPFIFNEMIGSSALE